MSLKDALHLWPSARPIKRKLDDAAIARLAKGFGLKKGAEPKNRGRSCRIVLKPLSTICDFEPLDPIT